MEFLSTKIFSNKNLKNNYNIHLVMCKLTIGITGGSASGKSTYANNLKKFINKINQNLNIIIISMDNFYKGLSSFTEEEHQLFKNNNLNLDAPSIINFEALNKLVKDLQTDRVPTQMPIYERMVYDVTSHRAITNKQDVIIIEGIFIFNNKEIRDLTDIKIFMDAPNHKRIERRLRRYTESKLDEQTEYYNKFVVPAYDLYTKPQKENCDFIIDGEEEFHKTLTSEFLQMIFNII